MNPNVSGKFLYVRTCYNKAWVQKSLWTMECQISWAIDVASMSTLETRPRFCQLLKNLAEVTCGTSLLCKMCLPVLPDVPGTVYDTYYLVLCVTSWSCVKQQCMTWYGSHYSEPFPYCTINHTFSCKCKFKLDFIYEKKPNLDCDRCCTSCRAVCKWIQSWRRLDRWVVHVPT